MKKYLYVFMILVITMLTLTACGNKNESNIEKNDVSKLEKTTAVKSVEVTKNKTITEYVPTSTLKKENSNNTNKINNKFNTTTTRNSSTTNQSKCNDITNSSQQSKNEKTTNENNYATTSNNETTTKKQLKEIPKYDTSNDEKYMFELTNKARQENGSPNLSWSDELQNLAHIRLEETLQKWDHERPNGTQFVTILYEYNIQYKYKRLGENLAKSKGSNDETFNALMNSEGHRKNILNTEFDVCGVAMCTGNDGYVYFVQLLGKMP